MSTPTDPQYWADKGHAAREAFEAGRLSYAAELREQGKVVVSELSLRLLRDAEAAITGDEDTDRVRTLRLRALNMIAASDSHG